MLDRSVAVPSSPEEITPEWLSQALRLRFPRVAIDDVRVTRIVWGTATKVLLEVDYAGADTHAAASALAAHPPRRLCVKAGLDRRLDEVSNNAIHTMEAQFYGELRDRFDTSAPTSYYAGVDQSGSRGLIILEDLAAAGCTFVEPGDALTPDQVASGLARQAAWHAATWGSTVGELPGVRVGSITRKAAKLFFSPNYWDAHFAQPDAPELPGELQNPETVYQAFKSVWEYDDVAVHCFQHGDAHLGNTFLRPDGGIGFVDWQCFCLGPWSYDVAYFLSGALTIDDRRAHEADLLRHYLGELRRAGGPSIDYDDAWPDYIRHLVHGLLWTMTPKLMQPMQRSRTMSDRHVAALTDHHAIAGI